MKNTNTTAENALNTVLTIILVLLFVGILNTMMTSNRLKLDNDLKELDKNTKQMHKAAYDMKHAFDR